jgi:hypothetical protein
VKADNVMQAGVEALVRWDPQSASEAELRTMGAAPRRSRPAGVRGRGEIAIVGDDDHAAVVLVRQIFEDLLHVGAGRGVEVSSRLISQDQKRIVGKRAGEGNPLALPTRKLPRQLVCFACHAKAPKQLDRARFDFRRR